MINEKGETLIEHHTHYKELHGVDKTVWMTRSEHTKLHNRLRQEGKCNVPPCELAKIATAAGQRTEKSKAHKKKYYEHLRKENQKNLIPSDSTFTCAISKRGTATIPRMICKTFNISDGDIIEIDVNKVNR